jgi:hypothetical protein
MLDPLAGFAEPDVESARGRGSRGARLLLSLPDRLPLVALAGFLVVSVTTTFGIFHAWLVIPAVVVAAILFWFLVPASPLASTPASQWGAVASLVIAVVWFAGNAPFVAQWFDPSRDPGLYFVHGLWFADHPASPVSIVRASALAEGIPKLTATLGRIQGGPNNVITLQGGDLLPGVIGAATWFGGLRAALLANLVLGSVGLVALYGAARRLLGPLWALVPQLALGFSVAYMYLARGPYSEIVMVIVGLAALTWVVSGVRSGSWRDFAVAGVFAGVASSARIDGVLVAMGAVVVLGVAGLGFLPRERRRPTVVGGATFIVFAAASTFVGVYGLFRNKASYVRALGEQPTQLWYAAFATVVLFALLWLVGRFLDARRLSTFWRWAAPVLGGVVGVVLLFWLSRPLWYIGRFAGPGGLATIAALQKEEGLPVDGHRSYEEQTLSWLGWYFGWPTVALAIVGFVVMVVLGVRRRNLTLLIAAVAPLSVAAVYFTRVAITPDQIWAFRRILPVITPGFLIAAVVPMALLWRRFASPVTRGVALGIAALVAFGPIVTWNGLLLVKDGGNQLTATEAICTAIGDAQEVLLIRDDAPINYGLAIKTACDTDVISVWSYDIKDGNLEALHERTGDIPVVAYVQGAMPQPRRAAPADLTFTVPRWNRHIDHLPDAIVATRYSLYFGTLKADGSVVAD